MQVLTILFPAYLKDTNTDLQLNKNQKKIFFNLVELNSFD